MKKIILSLAAVFAFGAASAQELVSSKGEEYLPKQGDWSIGFNVGNALTYLGQALMVLLLTQETIFSEKVLTF